MQTAMTYQQWNDEGARLFGPDKMNWRFKCPACGHVAATTDYRDAKATEGAIGFSCVGRWSGVKREAFGNGPGPCNYAGGGLFKLNPLKVTDMDGNEHDMFAFAEPQSVAQ